MPRLQHYKNSYISDVKCVTVTFVQNMGVVLCVIFDSDEKISAITYWRFSSFYDVMKEMFSAILGNRCTVHVCN